MRLDHVGIRARDVERTLAFYTEVLGLKRLETIEILGNHYYFVGNEQTRIEIEPAPAGADWEPVERGGLQHFALIVENLDALFLRLKERGTKIIIPPSRFRPDRKIAFIEDPDGSRIQLIELLKS
jgi:lactoylglutathione lyase